jgi:hypothetical protein
MKSVSLISFIFSSVQSSKWTTASISTVISGVANRLTSTSVLAGRVTGRDANREENAATDGNALCKRDAFVPGFIDVDIYARHQCLLIVLTNMRRRLLTGNGCRTKISFRRPVPTSRSIFNAGVDKAGAKIAGSRRTQQCRCVQGC